MSDDHDEEARALHPETDAKTDADRIADEMAQYLRQAVHRSLSSPAVLPRYEQVAETTARLRDFLTRLLPAARAHADTLPTDTPDWHRTRSVIDAARNELAAGSGPGLKSAVLHMQNVGRACHELRGVLPGRAHTSP
ncbi:DUF6415 family natural product biosynthesis protein [Streptomyces sp. NPDC049555]|uniref:DUF6415 family natural product biosynthesis protein n=1 Tax=unclassified Streptomyces TaxID=2593676 RepID=UPI00343F80E7